MFVCMRLLSYKVYDYVRTNRSSLPTGQEYLCLGSSSEYTLRGAVIPSLFPLSGHRIDGHLQVFSYREKSQKIHNVRGSPMTERPFSRTQQTCVCLGVSLNLPNLLLTPPLIHAVGQIEGRERMSENSWSRVTVVKEPSLAFKSRYGRGVVG